MKTFNAFTFIAMLAFAALTAPMAAFASVSGMPSFAPAGVMYNQPTRLTLLVDFDSQNAAFGYNERPKVGIAYTNTKTGATGKTSLNPQSAGRHSNRFTIYNLTPDTRYSYRAVMEYGGITYMSTEQYAITSSGSYTGSASSTSSASSTNSATGSSQNASSPASSSKDSIDFSGGLFSKATAKAKAAVITGGASHKNGVALLITNEEARVRRLDTITYTVKYQNTKSVSLKDGEIAVQLPSDYEFVKSSIDAEYDRDANIVTYTIGRIPAESLTSFTMTARAIGSGNGDVETIAVLSYNGGEVSATDRDTYSTGSQSVLGASVFGAGFFPQTLAGWMLLIFAIFVIIIVARRYMTAPSMQQNDQAKTA